MALPLPVEQLWDELQAVRAKVLGEAEGLSQVQADWKPTEKDWSVDPFAGTIRDGYIWGRGSWDDKGNLLSILEAIEVLLAQGFQPRQTVYVVAGHDEEAGGERGARQVAGLLAPRERNKTITCLAGAEPMAGAGMPGAAAAVLPVRVAVGGRADQRPAA